MLSVETVDVLICGYLSATAAREDFESVRHCGAYVHGATMVTRDLDGKLTVDQSDHIVREVAEGFGAVGFVLGWVVPPLLLASTGAAAAMGAGVGQLLHRLIAHELKQRAGATVPIGGAGLIVVYPKESGYRVRPAVTRAITTTTGEAEGYHVRAVRDALANAQHNTLAAVSG